MDLLNQIQELEIRKDFEKASKKENILLVVSNYKKDSSVKSRYLVFTNTLLLFNYTKRLDTCGGLVEIEDIKSLNLKDIKSIDKEVIATNVVNLVITLKNSLIKFNVGTVEEYEIVSSKIKNFV